MKKQVKHFRFSEIDQKNLNLIKTANDCFSENEAIRQALRIAAGVKE